MLWNATEVSINHSVKCRMIRASNYTLTGDTILFCIRVCY